MKMHETDGQLTLFDLDTWCGNVPGAFSSADGETSGRCSKKPAELQTAPFLYLDLREGVWLSAGAILGPEFSLAWRILDAQYWGLAQRRKESSLSQILQATPHPKYYLSKTACLGILRRAKKRGKELPPVLRKALEIQAGIRPAEEQTMNA